MLQAIGRATIDHRGPAFSALAREVFEGLRWLFRTDSRVFVHPSSATGAWEAALTNTLSPGDRVLVFERGFFGEKWGQVATRLGLDVQVDRGDWRRGVTAEEVSDRLRDDPEKRIRAVLVVHNETSTGVTTDLEAVGEAIRTLHHPALLMADSVSSLAVTDYRHDDWGVDVTVSGSQKGLMLPPGLSFTAVSPRALEAAGSAALPRAYWSWEEMLAFNDEGYFPYTPATNLLYGLREALEMLREEGLENVFARHLRHARATRTAVAAWGLENFACDPGEYSSAATTVLMPEGASADALRKVILDRFDMSLGGGLGKLKGRVFRIGHLGDFNDLMLAGTLAGVEMGLGVAGVLHRPGGVAAALDYLASTSEDHG